MVFSFQYSSLLSFNTSVYSRQHEIMLHPTNKHYIMSLDVIIIIIIINNDICSYEGDKCRPRGRWKSTPCIAISDPFWWWSTPIPRECIFSSTLIGTTRLEAVAQSISTTEISRPLVFTHNFKAFLIPSTYSFVSSLSASAQCAFVLSRNRIGTYLAKRCPTTAPLHQYWWFRTLEEFLCSQGLHWTAKLPSSG